MKIPEVSLVDFPSSFSVFAYLNWTSIRAYWTEVVKDFSHWADHSKGIFFVVLPIASNSAIG